MNAYRIERELRLYGLADSDLEEIKAELAALKSYDKPKTGAGRKNDIPDVADQVIARDRRRKELQEQAKVIRNRKKAVGAAFRQYKGHEYLGAVQRIYVQGQSVRLVAKDMRRDWRTVDRHARQLLGQIGNVISQMPGL